MLTPTFGDPIVIVGVEEYWLPLLIILIEATESPSRVANAVRNMSPERKAAYFKIMRETGTPTGNHPKNIQKLSFLHLWTILIL